MRWILASAAVIVAFGAVAVAHERDSFSDPVQYNDGPRDQEYVSFYDRVVAKYGRAGREVREEFRDGPCKIKRKWEPDGDYVEKIKCRGPRD